MALTDLNKEYSEFSSDFLEEIGRDLEEIIQESFERDRRRDHDSDALTPLPEADIIALATALYDAPIEIAFDPLPVAEAEIPPDFLPTDCLSTAISDRLQLARYRAEERDAAKREKLQQQAARRMRRYRARLKELPHAEKPGRRTKWAQRRLDALTRATVYSSDSFLRQLRGREELHVEYLEWAKTLGDSATDTEIALFLDCGLTKRSVQNIRKNVAKLEQPGMPWHGL